MASLGQFVGRQLGPTLVWQYPTPESLARHLAGETHSEGSRPAGGRTRANSSEPIAVIGLACRLPGAENPEALWQLLCEGVDAIREVPADRWPIDSYYDAELSAAGKMNTRWGGFLDRIDGFDPQFFGISPRESGDADPQQRLMLELAWEALEDAGIAPGSLKGKAAGVFFGAMWNEYSRLCSGDARQITPHSATGGDSSIITARVSYILGLSGPSLTVNTACSSSLVAVHLACQSLRTGECDIAMAGGVNLMLTPESTVAMSKFGAMAPDGRSKAFDARANGYVRGEGGGVVILKPLSQALAAGDPIYCVVRGSAINNDGFSNGLTAPNPQAQEDVLREACARSGVSPHQVQYVEAHGTGTMLGDPIEAGALGRVLGMGRGAEGALRIGSVKTNIGHLEAAAGVAGLIKVALAMKHRLLPASLHFERPNPHIAFEELGIRVQQKPGPWPRPEEPAVAGISSFGFGGTNCHVVVEEFRVASPEAAVPVQCSEVAFVFSGNGAQWLGMGRGLLADPVCYGKLRQCEAAFEGLADWRLLEVLASGCEGRLDDVSVVQPVIFAMQVALAALWESWGVRPGAVTGHSLGEVAAAHVAGILTLDDAARVVLNRSRLLKRKSGLGAMAVLDVADERAQSYVAAYGDALCVAALNSPESTVVSGDPEALDALLTRVSKEGVSAQRVRVDVAYHSPQVDDLKAELRESLEGIVPRPGVVPMVSSVTGAVLGGREFDVDYWARNLREPVQFWRAVGCLAERCRVFVEIAPHPILSEAVQETLQVLGRQAGVLPSLRRGEEDLSGLLRSLEALQKLVPSYEAVVPARRDRRPLHILALSAQTEPAIRDLARSYANCLAVDDTEQIADFCYTANTGRDHFTHRVALAADSAAKMRVSLSAVADGAPTGLWDRRSPRIAFLFTGQGSQYVGMGRQLYETQPVFREALEECQEILRGELSQPLLSVLYPRDGEVSPINETQFTQPALFALEYGLAQLWQSWGIRPDAVMGHSLGEYVAACVAGVFSLRDGLKLVATRARMMQSLPAGGRMAATIVSEDRVRQAIAGYEDRVSIAAVNGPASAVISGDGATVEEILGRLKREGISARGLTVSHAFHSPLMEPILGEFQRVLERVAFSKPVLPVVSNVTGRMAGGDDLATPAYWLNHLRQAVQFARGMETLDREGIGLFLELGPGSTMLAMGRECLPEATGEWLASLKEKSGDWEQMLGSLGRLYVRGAAVDWAGFDQSYPRRRLRLPTYPFQRQRYWIAEHDAGPGIHPLLGRRVEGAVPTFEWNLSAESPGFLKDHCVGGEAVLPATAYLEMALAAATEVLGAGPHFVEDLRLQEALRLPTSGTRAVQVVLGTEEAGAVSIRVFSRTEGQWRLHASAKIRTGLAGSEAAREALAAVWKRCRERISGAAHYDRLSTRGMEYGPAFLGIEEIGRGDRETVSRIRLPQSVRDITGEYGLHPALLDACLQTFLATLPEEEVQGWAGAFMPVRVESFRLVRKPEPGADRFQSHAKRRAGMAGLDFELLDARGALLAEMSGVHFERAAFRASAGKERGDWLYRMEWRSCGLANGQLFGELERLSFGYVVAAFGRLGWAFEAGQSFSVEGLAERLGVIRRHLRLLARMLEVLAEEGVLQGGPSHWEVVKRPEIEGKTALRRCPELALLDRSGSELGPVLCGETEPLQVIFGESAITEALYESAAFAAGANELLAETIAREVEKRGRGPVRILEIGGGTGGTTAHLLRRLPADRVEYVFTDLGLLFLNKAREKFAAYGYVRYEVLDIEKDPAAQGFRVAEYDVVVASNVLHATADLRATLEHVRKLLKPDGSLLLMELTERQRWIDLIFGTTEGWWKCTDRAHPLLNREQWPIWLREAGFAQTGVWGSGWRGQSVIVAGAAKEERKHWLILADSKGVGARLATGLEAAGDVCDVVSAGVGRSTTEDYERLLRDAGKYHGVVHLWSLDGKPGEPDIAQLHEEQERGCRSVLHLTQALAKLEGTRPPRLWVVTERAQSVRGEEAVRVAHAPIWGLAKVIALEHPDQRCTRIELENPSDADRLWEEIAQGRGEDQVAFRDGQRFVARLARADSTEPGRLEITYRGTLENLVFRPVTRRAPANGEVEIRVRAAGLNFRDVLNALSASGETGALGMECAGEVTSVGGGVQDLKPGDEVVALASGCFASVVTAKAALVCRKPEHLSFGEAAALPIVFLTVRHAFEEIAKLQKGQRVLIHAATGGVGLAAIQWARRVGAEIFGTAGSGEKRAWLRRAGVEHVMSSRTLDFAAEVMAATGGEGVDVVLNSLTGEFIAKGLGVLRAAGHFIEIGKAEIWSQDRVREVRPDVTYTAFDLNRMVLEAPDRMGPQLASLMEEFRSGNWQALPVETFALQDAQQAFRHMAQAKHIGKIALTAEVRRPDTVKADRTYLITGGFGGLGLLVADWLVDRGARHLVLAGRNAPAPAAAEKIAALVKRGVEVWARQVDVADRKKLGSLLTEIAETMAPLGGVIHSAGALDDGVLAQQSWPRFETVLGPKVDGAWNLHTLTRDQPLDFFILFSSVASALGSPGQGNHAAANAFLDALAHLRQSQGLPAMSINWGAWDYVGAAAERQVKHRMQRRGMGVIPPDEGVAVLQQLFVRTDAQVAVLTVDWHRFIEGYPAHGKPFLEDLSREMESRAATPVSASPKSDLSERLESSRRNGREETLAAFVHERALKVLGLAAGAALDPRQPLKELGLDSLMAVELRNILGKAVNRTLPAGLLFDYPTVETLTGYLKREVLALETPEPVKQAEAKRRDLREPIAIIGMSCRLPDARNVEEFWNLLRDGVDAVREVPAERWDADAYYDPDPTVSGKMNSRWGGFLESVDGFDPDFFGVAPREAVHMDPQQRLVLEVSWEALENAGKAPGRLEGSATGVFLGICNNDYARLLQEQAPNDAYVATGNAFSVAAGRVSYLLGLSGPSLAVDTACSSSLVTIHLACQSLHSGECRLALAGGVNLVLSPESTINFAKLQMLSPRGRCRTFDAGADGFVRGEGCGMVVLKRYSDAVADGDTVLAVIRGTAVNQDGRSNGLTAPNGPAQEAVIRTALAEAGVEPDDLSYVEAHGTGTPLGDPIEVNALGRVLGAERREPLLIGSVKTNLGHLESAAGVTGLIKIVLALGNEQIPPHLHWRTPSPHIPWQELPLKVATSLVAWPRAERERIAGVSSFGFSGTNAHAIVAEAPVAEAAAPGVRERPLHVLTLSAKSEAALREMAAQYAAHLATSSDDLGDLAYTANVGRSHFGHRMAVVAGTAAEAAEQLTASGRGVWQGEVQAGRVPRIGFLFTGQRSRHVGMERDLCETQPVFREAMDACEEIFRGELDRAQAALFAPEYGLAQLWRSWGIRPDVTMGHGLRDGSRLVSATGAEVDDGIDQVLELGVLWDWEQILGCLAKLYVSGAPVDWAEFDRPYARRKLRLPTYPFQRQRYWIAAREAGPGVHPLLGRRVEGAVPTFEWNANAGSPGYLTDHSVAGETVLPGTAYLEMALAAATEVMGEGSHFVEELRLQEALRLPSSGTRAVQVVLSTEDAGAVSMRFFSRAEAQWQLHASGKIRTGLTGNEARTEDPAALWRRCRERISGQDHYAGLSGRGMEYGPAFQGIEEIGRGEGETMARISLPQSAVGQAGQYGLHPVLLDACMQTFLATLPKEEVEGWAGAYMPVRVERFRLVRKPEPGAERFHAHAMRRTGTSGLDFELLDEHGVLLAEVSGAHFERATLRESARKEHSDWLYRVEWRSRKLTGGPAAASGKNWLILADGKGVGTGLAAALEIKGGVCHVASYSDLDDYERLLRQAGKFDGVVHLWSLDATPEEFDTSQEGGCRSVLHLTKGLTKLERANPPRLWVVTERAQNVSGDEAVRVANAPVWGLAKVIALEHPDLRCTRIDLDSEADADRLRDEIAYGGDEDQVAFRHGERFVARLARDFATGAPVVLRDDATYLVTGGLRGLGLLTAEWLAERGARHIVLAGRSKPSEAAEERIAELRKRGTEVRVSQMDVAARDQMERLLEEVAHSMPVLRGVIHAAGALDDGILAQQSWQRFETVFAAKVDGAWNLHLLTRELSLDFFVLFSSMASLLGSAGQANYAAGNAFLDALAHRRRAEGLPAISINWGAWDRVGLAAEHHVLDRLGRRGMGAMQPEDGLAMLGQLLGHSGAQVAVLPMDWGKFTSVDASLFVEDLRPRAVALKSELAQRLQVSRPSEQEEALSAFVHEQAVKVLGLAVGSSIDPQLPLKELGLDSLMAVELRNAVGQAVKRTLPAGVLFDYPTLDALTGYLKREVLALASAAPARQVRREAQTKWEPIAIIGMGCRFPGADGPDEFWDLLRDGVDAVREVPAERWDVEAYYDPDPEAPRKMAYRWGGFLDGVDGFDADFFGVSPREAIHMDPQQRLVLEVSWEALEHAGQAPGRLDGSATGVFLGICNSDYSRLLQDHDSSDAYIGTGNAFSVAAGRVSYLLGLEGPSLAVDTACSSSLVTVHLACQSLHSGECRMALAGGVNLVLSPESTVNFAKLRMLSPGGRCRTFDAAADGFVRGEGCGMVVLKRYSDAMADGDRVLAVIRGTAVNQDGRSNGLTAPNGPAQEAVIRTAMAEAGVEPDELGYVEAHGTGTPLGDPIEVNALGRVLGARQEPLPVGSVKTNLGHLESAAGVAGLIKVVLALGHEQIPPHLHWRTPSPHIPWEELPIKVATSLLAWPRGERERIAGISSFGFSGTNSHAIVAEAPATDVTAASLRERPLHVLTLSAKSDAGLREMSAQYATHLAATGVGFADLAYTANVGRSQFGHRMAVVAGTAAEAAERLTASGRGVWQGEVQAGRAPRIAFLFTGQGSQYIGMGRQLYETQPVFREALDECQEILREELNQPLLSVLYPADGELSPIDQTMYTQPALFALEYGLAQLWQSWGIRPNAVMGHSLGEYVAACVAGVFSLRDGLKLVAARARLMQSLPAGGRMAAVPVSEERVRLAIAGYENRVSIAALNGPASVVISGDGGAVEAIVAQLKREGIGARVLTVSHAFHSPMMEPMLGEFERLLDGVEFSKPVLPVISNVTGGVAAGDDLATPAYWLNHLRQAVQFARGMETLRDLGCTVFLEAGPAPVLLEMGMQWVPDERLRWVPSLRKSSGCLQQMLEGLAALYVAGANVLWPEFDSAWPRRKVALPTYPFQRLSYWVQGALRQKAVRETEPRWSEWFYDVQWQSKALVGHSGKGRDTTGLWLIFADASGLGRQVAGQLNQDGQECVLVYAGQEYTASADGPYTLDPFCSDNYSKLFAELRGRTIRAAVHLWSLDASGDAQSVAMRACGSGLLLTQQLIRTEQASECGVWFVTQGAQAAGTGGEIVNPSQAPLWGLAKGISFEAPQLRSGLVDLPGDALGEDIVIPLIEQILNHDGEDQIAFRHGERHVARLMRSKWTPAKKPPLRFSADGSYLIAGGMGKVGLRLARWLAERGAKHLVLTSRGGTPSVAGAIEEIESLGARVVGVAADVTDGSAMAALIGRFGGEFPALRGVVHAVADTSSGSLEEMDTDTLRRMLRGKVAGAWLLHELTRGMDLEMFVCFSSAASVFGLKGRAHYAAANQFLDALAHYRRSLQLPALTINWGNWGTFEGSAYSSAGGERSLEDVGLPAMEPEDALDAMAYLIQHGAVQKMVAAVDWQLWKPVYESRTERHLVDSIAVEAVAAVPAETSLSRGAVTQSREGLLEQVQREVREILAFDHRQPLDRNRGLFEMGMDSLSSAQLKRRLEARVGRTLPSTLIFTYPTIAELVEYLAGEVFGLAPKREEPAPKEVRRPSDLDSLTDDEIEASLLLELEKAGY